MEKLPILFRKESDDSITAVFPTIPGSPGMMSCYAHLGQHSSCSLVWYRGTRPARPEEYADLLTELRRIYEQGDDPVELQIVKRITQAHREARRAEERR